MDKQQQREVLLDNGDLLKLSLAGLLRDYEIQTWRGEAKLGKQMFYGPQIAGYCTQPWENVNYASCHDGETLFDQVSSFIFVTCKLDNIKALKVCFQCYGRLNCIQSSLSKL